MASTREISIRRDGLTLRGRIDCPRALPAPAVILFHGFAGDIGDRPGEIYQRITEMLVEAGQIVVRFDFNGHGKSDGDFTQMDPFNELEDAFEVLDYVLLSAPGAPLKQALLDAGIGKDVEGGYDDGIYQPFFSVVVKNSELSRKEQFLQVIRETLEKLAREGLDKAYGARPLRRLIRSKVEDPAAEALLSGQFHSGDSLVLTVRENNLAIAPLVR